MRSLRARFACSVLVLAAGLAGCSKDERTALQVNVTLDSDVASTPPDQVTFKVSRPGTGATFTNQQAPWSAASGGTLKVTLLLPAEAAGDDTLEVGSSVNGIAAAPKSVTISAGQVNGPISVVLKRSVVIADAGADTLPSDGAGPDMSGSPEVGNPDAGVAPDARINEPGLEAALPDAPLLPDGLQPADVGQLTDALLSLDVPQSTDVPQSADALASTDAVEAGADAEADSIPSPSWQPVKNVQDDPSTVARTSAVAVDPVNEHVYVIWVDFWAVNVRRWNRTTASWESTQTLEYLTDGDPREAQIGVDGKGNVIAAWYRDQPTDTSLNGVRVSQSTDGGKTWSTPAPVSPLRWVVEMNLAVARNGTARIAYSEKLSSDPYTVQLYSTYYDGKTWTAGPNPLAPETAGDQNFRYPSVAISDTGSGIILFNHKDATGYESVAVVTFAGGILDPYLLLDTNTTNDLTQSAVAVNREGKGAVAWADAIDSKIRSYSPSVGWSSPQSLGNQADLGQVSAVMASDGTVTLAWSQWVASHYNLWTMEGTVGGTWTAPAALETGNLASDITNDALPRPALAIDGAGNVLVLWRKKTAASPSAEYAVYAGRKQAGVWQPAVELARKPKLMPSYYMGVAVSDKGLGAACYLWVDPESTFDADTYQVFVSLYR